MKLSSLFIVIAFTMGLPAAASAQKMMVYPVATNFDAQGRVLELDFPPEADGMPFFVVWRTKGGQFNVPMQARGGRHCYEMRNRTFWEGRVTSVLISVPGVPGRVKEPTFPDEADMFMETEHIVPATVNLVRGHPVFGRSANDCLLALLAVSAFCFARFRKMPVQLAIVSGFLVAWGLSALITVYDHVAIVRTMERRGGGMFPLADVAVFADRASEMIGRASWGDDLDSLYEDCLHYRLAEQQYVPVTSGKTPAFWITRNPGQDPIVWKYGDYYLERKPQP
jgi:hypothetical protein